MKKRFLVLIVCACTIIGAIVSAAGSTSQDSAVVSRSYLEGAYLQDLVSMISTQVSTAKQNAKTAALEKLNSIGQSYLDLLAVSGGAQTEWLSASGFTGGGGNAGDTLALASGAGVIWTSGAADFTGTLIDLTDGVELTDGKMTAGHRYIAATESTITITGAIGYWTVEGEWKTTSDGITIPEILFEDIPPESPYYSAVSFVVEQGLFVGMSDTKFSPELILNRGMMATVLYRLAGEPDVAYRPAFSDVPDGKWYTSGVIWAADNAVVIGMGNDMYAPTDKLTYQQVAIMLYNYANWMGIDTSGRTDLSSLPGGSRVSGWASEQMSWAVSNGIMVTDDTGNLLAREDATRGNVAIIMQRFDVLIREQSES